MSASNVAKISILLFFILGGAYVAFLYLNRTPVINDVMPEELARTEWTDNIFKNVKGTHVFVCMEKQIEIPNWLDHDALVADTLDYIKNSTHIEYSDHQQHVPDLGHCNSDLMLEKSNQLNFITNVTTTRLTKDNREIPIAIVSRYIFRPDYRGSIASFVIGHPLVYDLSDEATARKSYDLHRTFWTIGAPK